MPVQKRRSQANAIKDTGASKKRTKEIADRTLGGAVRKPAREAATGQGGSEKGRRARGEPGTGHISERGGVKADSQVMKRRTSERKGKTAGAKTPGTGLVKGPSRQRAGPAAAGGRSRTGRDQDGRRGLARGGSRTRGRSQGSRG
jgi:hypothetical protein